MTRIYEEIIKAMVDHWVKITLSDVHLGDYDCQTRIFKRQIGVGSKRCMNDHRQSGIWQLH